MFLLSQGLGVKSLQFIRLPAFVIFWLLSRFAGSPRARQRIWMYQYTNNGTTVVDHTIALLIGTVRAGQDEQQGCAEEGARTSFHLDRRKDFPP